jgi:hypothetical protein
MATGRATQPSSKERLTPIEATPLKMGPIESVRPAISSSRFLLRRFAGSGAPGALAFSTPASSFAQLLENPSQFPAPCHISHPFIGPGAEMRGPHFLANAWRRFRAKLGATEESLGLAGTKSAHARHQGISRHAWLGGGKYQGMAQKMRPPSDAWRLGTRQCSPISPPVPRIPQINSTTRLSAQRMINCPPEKNCLIQT